MTQRLVEITSEDPGLLAALVKAKQGEPYTIIERKESYYLSFFDSEDPKNTEKAEQSANVLLANINAMLMLPPFKVGNALKRTRTNRIITLDENGNEFGRNTVVIPASASISVDFTVMDFSSFIE